MVATVSVSFDTLLRVQIQLGIVPAILGTDPMFIYQIPALGNTGGSQISLSGTSAAARFPVVTSAWEGIVPCVAGTATLDLTALVTAGLSNTNMTGLKIVAMKVQAASTNTNPVSIKAGVTNGYTPIGAGIPLQTAGDEVLTKYLSAIYVDATHKILTITGTGTEAVNMILVFGT